MMKSLKDCFKLYNGIEIPCIGYGTYLTPDGKTAVDSVKEAISLGYRHIDTAAAYDNEKSVGKAIKECGIDRKDLFITSKLWNSEQGYDSTLKAFNKTLSDLNLEYLDLYLIHWPIAKGHENDWQIMNKETWRAFEKLYDEGKIRAIGVSNFKPHHLDALMQSAKIAPMVNQIELHPGMNQNETVAYCNQHNILVEAWGPFSQGMLFGLDLLQAIATKYKKTIAQIALRWHLQKGILPLPKSVTPSRIAENADIFDFTLSDSDMLYIDNLDGRIGSGLDSDKCAF